MADPRFLGRNTGYVPGGGNGWTLPAELGYIAQSVIPEMVVPGISTVGAAGSLFLRRMSLPGPIVVTDMSMIISVVGVSADQSANWVAGVGLNTTPLTAPAGSNGLGIDTPYCYCGYWYNGTTPPFWARGGTADIALVNAFPAAPQARAVSANTGLTTAATVPTQLNLGTLTKIANTHGNIYYALR